MVVQHVVPMPGEPRTKTNDIEAGSGQLEFLRKDKPRETSNAPWCQRKVQNVFRTQELIGEGLRGYSISPASEDLGVEDSTPIH